MIHYHIQWRPSGNQPGGKRGLAAGVGDQLRALVLLRDHPDPRRLDLRTSIRDPFERLWVKDFYLNTACKVIVLLDASASMSYQGQFKRMHIAQDIASQIALSAYHVGDPFGLYCGHKKLINEATLPTRLNRSAWLWVRQKLAHIKAEGDQVSGLIQAAALLPKRRSLVFVISDFRWPVGLFQNLLKVTQHHDVVPIMLQDPQEYDQLPKAGFSNLQDMETGQSCFVWMRASMIERIRKARERHVNEISNISKAYGCRPFLVKGQFNSLALTKYFLERRA